MGCDYYIVVTLFIVNNDKNVDTEHIEYKRIRMYDSFQYKYDSDDDYEEYSEREYDQIKERCHECNKELYANNKWSIKSEIKIQEYTHIINLDYLDTMSNIKSITKYYNFEKR